MSGKYGPHGKLFFFLIQKLLAPAPVDETFSPLINLGIRSPFFSADLLKKCALIALHVIVEEGRDGDGCHVTGLGKNGKWAAQRVQSGRVKAKPGRKTEVCLS